MAFFKIRFINSSNSVVGRAIDWFTNSLIDHVEIETETGTWIGAHASGGVQELPADYCTPTWERRYAIPCTEEQLSKAMAFARSKIGTKYDYLDILGLMIHNRRFHRSADFVCSCFTIAASQAGDIAMLNVLAPYDYLITPETLHLSPLLIGRCTYAKV